VQRLAVEDGAQVLKLYPADKYNVGFGTVCHALAEYCAAPLPALRNLAIQAAFALLSGNGDLHAKNVSMVQQPHGEWSIAPVYDIPSTVVYGDKTLALTLGGKRSGISRKHFLAWSTGLGLPERTAVQAVDLALKAAGPLLADLEAGTAFRIYCFRLQRLPRSDGHRFNGRRRRLAFSGHGHQGVGQGAQAPAAAAGGVSPGILKRRAG
jgi:serine/threonine-protein kinase HipA